MPSHWTRAEVDALLAKHGTPAKAAAAAGVSRQAFSNTMKTLGYPRRRKGQPPRPTANGSRSVYLYLPAAEWRAFDARRAIVGGQQVGEDVLAWLKAGGGSVADEPDLTAERRRYMPPRGAMRALEIAIGVDRRDRAIEAAVRAANKRAGCT